MGDNPTIRILDFLITGRDFDYSLTDIANNSGVGWATLYRLWPGFIKNKMVIPTRIIGKAKLFQLNNKNEAVQQLVKLYKAILREEMIEVTIEKPVKKRTLVKIAEKRIKK